jgi:hypothetical protein
MSTNNTNNNQPKKEARSIQRLHPHDSNCMTLPAAGVDTQQKQSTETTADELGDQNRDHTTINHSKEEEPSTSNDNNSVNNTRTTTTKQEASATTNNNVWKSADEGTSTYIFRILKMYDFRQSLSQMSYMFVTKLYVYGDGTCMVSMRTLNCKMPSYVRRLLNLAPRE